MFLTADTNKHPLSAVYGKGNHLWTGIDVLIRRVWFIVDYRLREQVDGDGELTFTSTALLASGEDVLSMAGKNTAILSVSLMAPLPGQSGGWTIDRLTKIWECADPADPRINAKIYSKEDGSHHVDSLFEASADQLEAWTLLLELPACAGSSRNDLDPST
ncbi:UNVERIFIED_CONTAM: hypothetical protein NO986_10765 [Comamonas sp. A-3]|uniref:hypothetical protein n=1 Tax=Comamonas testosteroni TaxID=285 RepID=UPI0028E8C706|nr:hypothetical protein [Comamonas testosteroni]